jgi:hypothetical protein
LDGVGWDAAFSFHDTGKKSGGKFVDFVFFTQPVYRRRDISILQSAFPSTNSTGGQYNIVVFSVEYHRGRDALFWTLGGMIVAGANTFLAAPNAKQA